MTLIALVDSKWGIAKDGKQICRIPEDMRYFRRITLGAMVIMGRKTYEAIGHPLDVRGNVVISRSMELTYGVIVIRDIRKVRRFAYYCDDPIYVIGGESIYRQMLPYCDKALITMVYADLGADQFAPNLDADSGWELCEQSPIQNYENLSYSFNTYMRR